MLLLNENGMGVVLAGLHKLTSLILNNQSLVME
jgi:hypothetical protein